MPIQPHNGNPEYKQNFNDKFKNVFKKYDSKRILYPIIGINALIFMAWRVPAAQKFMAKHFLCNFENIKQGRIHNLITCNWSHMG